MKMKRKTKREISRIFQSPTNIIGIVFTFGGFFGGPYLVSLLKPFLGLFWSIVFLIDFFILIILVLFYIYLKSKIPEINYFEPVNFGKPEENMILKAIDGILNTEKVEPFYVHAAPKSKEVETIHFRLKEIGFAMLSGGPGEGKSMVAYHAAYRFHEEDRYRVYAFIVERLGNKKGKEIINEVLSQLDNLKGKRKLIIVDDAHNLAIKKYLNTMLQQEAKEGHGKYIWIETDFYEKKQVWTSSDMYIQVDFQKFFGNLIENFYKSQDSIFQKTLEGRIEGLKDAIERVGKNKIHDAWHFAFVASKGEERLSKEINLLEEPESLILFLISAYTVLSGETELSINYLLDTLGNLKFGWLLDYLRTRTFRDYLRSLQEQQLKRKSMIRIYEKSKSDKGYIASLHYNFARAVIRASLLRKNLVKYLLSSVKEILTSDYRKCAYFGVFHRDLEEYAAEFDGENKDWLINFVNNLLLEYLKCYPPLLRGIKSVAEDIYNEIIENLDVRTIAEKISSAEAGQFQQIAYLLNAAGYRRDELLKSLDIEQLSKKASGAEVGQFQQIAYLLNAAGDSRDELLKRLDIQLSKKASGAEAGQFGQIEALINAAGDSRDELLKNLDIEQLSKKASGAEVEQFGQIEALINAAGDSRDELLKNLDIEQLSKKASGAEVEQFQQISQLLNVLGDRKDELLKKLNYNILGRKATQVNPSNIGALRGLTLFIAQLDEEHRDRFVREVQWNSICKQCPINIEYLPVIGVILKNLIKQAELLPNTNTNDVAEHLRDNMDEVKKCIKETDFRQYRGLSKFLWNCSQINHQLAIEIMDDERMNKMKERFGVCERIPPHVGELVCHYRGVGELINSLYKIDPHLSKDFIEHNNVRWKIEQAINTHDWSKEKEDLKHMIKAFYKSAPELWKKMVSRNCFTVDLSSLDLDSIYRDVDEKRSAGTAYNTT